MLNQLYGRTTEQLHLTLCEIIGMNPQAVEEHFQQFLHQHPNLTTQQVYFMNLLKNHIAQHCSIVVEQLYDVPFTAVSHEGIDGVLTTDDVTELVAVLKPFLKQEAKHDR